MFSHVEAIEMMNDVITPSMHSLKLYIKLIIKTKFDGINYARLYE